MIIDVIRRNESDLNMEIITVEISPLCPSYGNARGEVKKKSFCEDGGWYVCDTWINPCGHIDTYVNVIKEAHG